MKKLISIYIVFLFSLLGMAQTQSGYVEIKGKVKQNSKSLSAVNIDVFLNNTKIKSVKTESNGKFILNLDFDKTYIIEFSKKDFVSKKVSFDTHVKEKQYVWPYPFTLELFKMIDGLDVSALKDPVTKISYSEDEGDFAFDIPYTNGMKSKINNIQNQIKALEQNAYAAKISAADLKFREKDYESAIHLYEQAIDINAYTDYPDNQIIECERRLANKDKDEADYNKLIADADNLFNSKQYEQAKKDYSSALKIFSDKPYPKGKIEEINKLLAQQGAKEKQDQYDKIIKQADVLFASKDFNNSKIGYQKALEILPTEEYPKGRIAEIDAQLADLERNSKINAQYDDKIAEGDRLFTKMEYQISRNAYVSATKIKPNEQYPKDRIAAIDKKMSEMEEDRTYADKIKNADANFAQKQLENAKILYTEALALKPSESYPKTKISEIEALLAQQSQQLELEKNYTTFISQGDNALASSDYTNAKQAYQSALQLKPKEIYPKDKISEIDGLLSQINAKKEKDKAYSDLIQSADAFLADKNYSNAKQDYTKALNIKPKEAYPKDKVSEIDALLAKIKEQENIEKSYNNKIQIADLALSKKQYNEAKSSYQEALTLKPNESYPKEKISEIDRQLALINEKNAKEKEFNDLISAADQQFKSEAYVSAKTTYQSALKLKSDASYPQTQIVEIDKRLKLIAENKANEEAYQNKIKKADLDFQQKDYQNAKTAYLEALTIKPKETYPQTKVKEIDAFLANLANEKQKNELYSQHIKSGDSRFASKNFTEAKMAFQSALDIKPAEQYPKNKISEIETLLQQLAEKDKLDKQYQDAISKADVLFSKKDLEQAKTAYQTALQIKKNEQYPKNKIAEIDALVKILADQKAQEALDKQYQDAISKADAFMAKKELKQARTAYQSALQIKSNESYPKDKISEIDALIQTLASQKAKDEQYDAYISSANTKFANKQYEAAKSDYLSASQIKSEENLPKAKIKEIDAILNQLAAQKSKDESYAQFINLADAAFKAKDYQDAKSKYQEALKIKSEEAYPKSQLTKIDAAIAQLEKDKALNDKYQAEIKKADLLLTKKDYTNAKPAYEAALALKPSESYPKTKIQEIETTLAALAKQKQDAKALDDNYKAKIAEGDRLLAKREYNIAKKAYVAALEIKPAEQYPKDKISIIDGKLAEMAKDVEYAARLKEGSESLTKKNYEDAKLAFTKASEIKPNESYPKDQIKLIEGIISKNLADEQKLEKYKALIKQANENYDAKSYEASLDLYRQASTANPSAKFPKDRIIEINRILAEQSASANQLAAQNAKKKRYADMIEKADKEFSNKEYKNSKLSYKSALNILPGEVYPTSKIKEIDEILAKELAEIPEEIDFSNVEEKKKFMSTMAQKYGEGVHEEKYESESGKQVRRIIVVKSGLADEYREVKQPWGATYFFKNGKNVGRSIFYKETKQ